MCYRVYISTDSPQDLNKRNSEFVRFERVTTANADPCTGQLDFVNQWYVGSKTGCSCTFRHLHSADELGFGEPEDWMPEEKDDIEATKELYAALASILSSGHQADLIDLWGNVQPEEIKILDVSLDKISEAAFRMFENYKFRLSKEKTSGPSIQ